MKFFEELKIEREKRVKEEKEYGGNTKYVGLVALEVINLGRYIYWVFKGDWEFHWLWVLGLVVMVAVIYWIIWGFCDLVCDVVNVVRKWK